MDPSLKRLLQTAEEAIEQVVSYSTVPLEETREALEELQAKVEGALDGVRDDIKRAE